MSRGVVESRREAAPKPEGAGANDEKNADGKNRRRNQKSNRCGDLPPGHPATHLFRIIAEGAAGLGVDIANRLGFCADDTCGVFDAVSPSVVGLTIIGLEAIYRVVRCRQGKRREDGGERPHPNFEIEASSENEPAAEDEMRERRIEAPTPAQVLEAAHRPDAIVVPEDWLRAQLDLDPLERGDCGGFDPKGPIVFPNGELRVPSPCPQGVSEGCNCTALEAWVARARRSLEAAQN